MGQNLTQSLVDLRCLGFAAQRNSEFRLDHMERRFDVRPLVVRLQELVTTPEKVVVHLPVGSARSTVTVGTVGFERDVRTCSEGRAERS